MVLFKPGSPGRLNVKSAYISVLDDVIVPPVGQFGYFTHSRDDGLSSL